MDAEQTSLLHDSTPTHAKHPHENSEHKIIISACNFSIICIFEVLQVSLVLLLLITYYVDAIYFGYRQTSEEAASLDFPLQSNSSIAEIVDYLYHKAHPTPVCVPQGEQGPYYLAISELVSIFIYGIYFFTGLARIGVFLGTIYKFAQGKALRYLFVLDSLFALSLVMCFSYIGFVPSLSFPAPSTSSIASIPKLCPEADALIPLIVVKQLLGWICIAIFCAAIFAWNGMFRVLTERVQFSKKMIIVYKWIRIYGACINILVAILVLKSNQVFEGYELGGKNKLFDYELFLLFIVNAVVYILEMYFHLIKHVETKEHSF